MLHPEKIRAALAAKQSLFAGAQKARSTELATLNEALEKICALDFASANKRLAAIERPGAKPTEEFDAQDKLIVPFEHRWSNHEQARVWAREILEGVPTFAVDGSQIVPTKEISVPIGLVQIGWFENPHTQGGEYIKDLQVEVLSPPELAESSLVADELGGSLVNLRRFEMETARVTEYLHTKAGNSTKPLALFDGTLIVSFAGLMQPGLQDNYVKAVKKLIGASTQSHVPLIGFVDSSSAHDLVDMISHLAGINRMGYVTDAGLLQDKMGWGDRSQVFICARNDNLLEHDYYESVCFCYLKTTSELPPARVEFPRWLLESGEYLRALDLLRAECVVGTGYPYALETADALAVIDLFDRERFYRLVQQFTTQSDIKLTFTRKSTSKRERR